MYYVENAFLSTFNLQPTAYFRYIDDIFLIWLHGIDTLETFLEDANRTHPNICFTYGHSTTAASFLDVIIKINNGIMATSLSKKHRQPSLSPLHQMSSYAHEKFYDFFTASQMQKNMFRQKGFYQTKQRTSHTLIAHRLPY